ncbi:DUF5133 domain-containing protein [Streptomyces hypolithicus]
MAHPVVLRELVEQYRALQALDAGQDVAESTLRLEDVVYTLCVSTGTRTVEAALSVAEERLGAVRADASEPTPEDVRLTA